jgi:pre-rRNA-processing protein TSR4
MSTEVTSVAHSGLGCDMFNSATPVDPCGTITSQDSVHDEECIGSDDDSASTSSASSVILALASVTLVDSLWQSAPSYPPQYLSTANEYIPTPNKASDELTEGIVDDGRDTQEGHPGSSEKYENSMNTDHLFDKFNQRAAHWPQQCVRCAPLHLHLDVLFV